MNFQPYDVRPAGSYLFQHFAYDSPLFYLRHLGIPVLSRGSRFPPESPLASSLVFLPRMGSEELAGATPNSVICTNRPAAAIRIVPDG